MAHKKILATLMAMVMATSIAAYSKTDTKGSADTSAAADPAVESDQGPASGEEPGADEDSGEDTEDFSEFYSLENKSASEIKEILEKYYTEIIPAEGQSSDEFRKSLPVIPERIVNGSPETKCFASYRGLDTKGHSRIMIISWEGFIEDESGNAFVKAEVNDPKATFDIVLKGKDLALELLGLYRKEVEAADYDQVDYQEQGDIYQLAAASDFVDQKATKTVTVMISPGTAEPGDDFWMVTVKHSYVK